MDKDQEAIKFIVNQQKLIYPEFAKDESELRQYTKFGTEKIIIILAEKDIYPLQDKISRLFSGKIGHRLYTAAQLK